MINDNNTMKWCNENKLIAYSGVMKIILWTENII